MEQHNILINDKSTAFQLHKEYRKVRDEIKKNSSYEVPEIVVEGSANPIYVVGIPDCFFSVKFSKGANHVHSRQLPKYITDVNIDCEVNPDIYDDMPDTVSNNQFNGMTCAVELAKQLLLSTKSLKRSAHPEEAREDEPEDEPEGKLDCQPLNRWSRF